MVIPAGMPLSSKHAYITLLTRDSYLPGVQALARSLAAVQAGVSLIAMHTGGLSNSSLRALQSEPGCLPLEVKPYLPAGVTGDTYKLQLYLECWSKLRMWQLDWLDRVVYLDADMIVCKNMDFLFDLPPGMYAVADCTAGRATAQERSGCQLFGMECGKSPAYFNAGFLVFSPAQSTFATFDRLLSEGAMTVGQYAEQDFLNGVYQGQWMALPWAFNAQKCIKQHHPHLWALESVHILHYVDAKPWQAPRGADCHAPWRPEVQRWWDVFERRHAPALPGQPA